MFVPPAVISAHPPTLPHTPHHAHSPSQQLRGRSTNEILLIHIEHKHMDSAIPQTGENKVSMHDFMKRICLLSLI